MALIKYGAGVAGMSGTVGGQTYARSRTGNYARSWRKPVNTPSAARSIVRGVFGEQAGVWSTLTTAAVNQWNALAATVTRLNRLGEAYVPTGRQIFLEANLNLDKVGAAAITVPPADLATPDAISRPVLSATITSGALTVLTLAGVTTGLSAYVRATPPLPPSRNNVNDFLRGIGPVTGSATPIDILEQYADVFGDFAEAGQVITAEVQVVSIVNGMASPRVMTRLTLS